MPEDTKKAFPEEGTAGNVKDDEATKRQREMEEEEERMKQPYFYLSYV